MQKITFFNHEFSLKHLLCLTFNGDHGISIHGKERLHYDNGILTVYSLESNGTKKFQRFSSSGPNFDRNFHLLLDTSPKSDGSFFHSHGDALLPCDGFFCFFHDEEGGVLAFGSNEYLPDFKPYWRLCGSDDLSDLISEAANIAAFFDRTTHDYLIGSLFRNHDNTNYKILPAREDDNV